MTVSQIKRRLKREDLDWFDVNKYQPAEDMTLEDWVTAFRHRTAIGCMVDISPSVDDPHIAKYVSELMEHPIRSLRPGANAFDGLATGRPKVWDKQLFYFLTDLEIINHPKMSDFKSVLDLFGTEHFDEASDVLFQSVDEVSRERGLPMLPEQVVHVDLNATDERLVSDFRVWLNEKRTRLASLAPKRNVSAVEMKEWAQFCVLGCIDLDIFSRSVGGSISNATLGLLLFPNEYDVDLSERVRKVTRPMAAKVMSGAFLHSIADQVSRSE